MTNAEVDEAMREAWRLGRSIVELLATVTMLKERGVALLSLEEKIDTSSAAGELVFHVFGALAHFERRLIAERTSSAAATSSPAVSAPLSSSESSPSLAFRNSRQGPHSVEAV